ncbi:MAG: TIM barrel protein [Planctomycetes bacterium]|nr:TIM barrel protein [Planctomycetota bacterium]
MSPFSRRKFLSSSAAAGAAGMCATSGAADDVGQIGKTPHTKFAVNVEMWFRNLPFLERIDQVARLGFSGFEFWPWRGKDIDAVARKCEQHKLTPVQFSAWGFTPGMNDPKNRDRIVPEIRAACEIAKRLGTELLCVVAGNDVQGRPQKEMHATVIEHLKMAGEVAEKQGVTLMLEAMNGRVDHKGHCLYTTADTVAIIQAVGSPRVKIMHDLYHRQIAEGDLHGHITDHLKDIVYFQLADHPGRHEPGTGEINYNAVLKHIYQLGYRGWIGLECTPKGDPIEAARAVARADVW